MSKASATNLQVAYHDGGRLFAGDDQDYAPGWYLFDGEGARPVTVFKPYTNEPEMGPYYEEIEESTTYQAPVGIQDLLGECEDAQARLDFIVDLGGTTRWTGNEWNGLYVWDFLWEGQGYTYADTPEGWGVRRN